MMIWCFNSFQYFKENIDARVTIKGCVQLRAIQSGAEFSLQWGSNPGSRDLKLGDHEEKPILYPVSILYKSIAGRYWPFWVADGPITTRCIFIKNASWDIYIYTLLWYLTDHNIIWICYLWVTEANIFLYRMALFVTVNRKYAQQTDRD